MDPVATDANTGFVVYSHIGVGSQSPAPGQALGSLTLRPDLRGPAGVLAAPLVVSVLDSVATATLPIASAIPTRVDLDVFDAAADVAELRVTGTVRRSGRSQIYYDALVSDTADPDRLIAYGSVTMAVTGPPVKEYAGHRDSAAAESTDRPLTEVFGGAPAGEGRYEITELTGRIGFGKLHLGPMTVMAEAAATDAVERRTGTARTASVRTSRIEAHVLSAGKVGPFTVEARVLAADDAEAVCRVEVVDRGAGSRVNCVITTRHRLVSDKEAPCTRCN